MNLFLIFFDVGGQGLEKSALARTGKREGKICVGAVGEDCLTGIFRRIGRLRYNGDTRSLADFGENFAAGRVECQELGEVGRGFQIGFRYAEKTVVNCAANPRVGEFFCGQCGEKFLCVGALVREACDPVAKSSRSSCREGELFTVTHSQSAEQGASVLAHGEKSVIFRFI